MDLTSVPTEDLLNEAMSRKDVRDQKNILSNEAFIFARTHLVLPAVDGLPIKISDNNGLELGFIIRNTGLYKGTWWLIGGRIHLGETNEMALRRNFREVLGVEINTPLEGWFKPAAVGQYVRDLKVAETLDVGHNPPYQTTAPIYLVTLQEGHLKYGETSYGGQEASAFRWFPIDKLPPKQNFGYRGYRFIEEATLTLKLFYKGVIHAADFIR